MYISGPRRTWIVGDSFVARAGKNEPQLAGGGSVFWKGVGGLRIAGLDNRMRSYLYRWRVPYPSTIVLHVGCNDLFRSNLGDIRSRIKENLLAIRNTLPQTTIIWSDVLPRHAYFEERD